MFLNEKKCVPFALIFGLGISVQSYAYTGDYHVGDLHGLTPLQILDQHAFSRELCEGQGGTYKMIGKERGLDPELARMLGVPEDQLDEVVSETWECS